MSRSVQPTNYRRDPMPLSAVLAETFRHAGEPEDLTAWVDGQEIPGQGVLFCDEVNTEFTSTATTCTFTGHSTHCTGCTVDSRVVYHVEFPMKRATR